MAFFRKILNVGGASIFGQILGYFRDLFIGIYIGSSMAHDIFLISSRIPHMTRRVMLDGALSATIIPGMRNGTIKYNKDLLYKIVLFFIFLNIILWILLPYFINCFIDKHLYTSTDLSDLYSNANIMIWSITIFSISTMLISVLHFYQKFGISSWSNIIVNGSIIFCAIVFGLDLHNLAFSIIIGNILQIIILSFAAKKYLTKDVYNNNVLEIIKNIIINSSSFVVYPIISIFNTYFSSKLGCGAISSVHYADRICALPITMIGLAVSTVVLANKNKSENTYGYMFGIITTIPASIALMFFGPYIAKLLFGYGKMLNSVQTIGEIARYFSLSIFLSTMNKIIGADFFSENKGRIVNQSSVIQLVITLSLSYFMHMKYGCIGIAVSSIIGSFARFIYIARIRFFQQYGVEIIKQFVFSICVFYLFSNINCINELLLLSIAAIFCIIFNIKQYKIIFKS